MTRFRLLANRHCITASTETQLEIWMIRLHISLDFENNNCFAEIEQPGRDGIPADDLNILRLPYTGL